MDIERHESTIYHLGKLHKAEERPLYCGITAGGIICHRACMMTLPPQTVDTQIASEVLTSLQSPVFRSLLLIHFRDTNLRRKVGGLGCFLQNGSATQFNNEEHRWI